MEKPRPDTGPLRDFLRSQMKANGWTQSELATRMGVSAAALNRWLLGRAQPDVNALRTAGHNMGWDLDRLLLMSGHREGGVQPHSRQEDLCERLKHITLTDDRYIALEALIEKFASIDREARTMAR